MPRLHLVLLAVLISCVGITYVHACEEACRGDPVTFLTKRYQAVLEHQAKTISDPDLVKTSRRLIPSVVSKITGRHGVVDKTIFNMFRGPCANNAGLRAPSEFCGSAKSIACFAPWGHSKSVFDNVHKAVLEVVKNVYKHEMNPEIQAAMVEGVSNFCPVNCDDWVVPFQNIMLVWEQREHPDQYKVTPNCLPLRDGGV